MVKKLKEHVEAHKKRKKKINDLMTKSDTLVDILYKEIIEWRTISNCSDPASLERKLNKISSTNTNDNNWIKATKCKTPQEAQELIISLQNDDTKEMYDDFLCRMYMWNFDGKPLKADQIFTSLNLFYEFFDIALNVIELEGPEYDDYNFFEFLKFLHQHNISHCADNSGNDINIKEIVERYGDSDE